jgi:hypothetical protein
MYGPFWRMPRIDADGVERFYESLREGTPLILHGHDHRPPASRCRRGDSNFAVAGGCRESILSSNCERLFAAAACFRTQLVSALVSRHDEAA